MIESGGGNVGSRGANSLQAFEFELPLVSDENTMPLVSAIITTHNRSHLLNRAIESVLKQTYERYELIVVDDASSDRTPEILHQYEIAGSLRIVRIETSRGANHARNQGTVVASGEYLAFLDDDDVWMPEKLSRQIQIFQSSDDVVLVGSWYLKGGHLERRSSIVSYPELLSDNILGSFSNCMFRKSDVEFVGGMDESLQNAQDWDLWLRLGELGSIFVVQECLVDYSISEPDRITVRRDRRSHYANYMAVVCRHKHKMSYWQLQMHRSLVAYHTTPKTHKLTRLYRGAYYGLTREISKVFPARKSGDIL